MRDHLEACGFPYLVTDNVDQAIAWLKSARHPARRRGADRVSGFAS